MLHWTAGESLRIRGTESQLGEIPFWLKFPNRKVTITEEETSVSPEAATVLVNGCSRGQGKPHLRLVHRERRSLYVTCT